MSTYTLNLDSNADAKSFVQSGAGLSEISLYRSGTEKFWMALLFGLIALMGIFYLVQFNSVATRGYEIVRLEYQRDQLLNQREQKNISLSESQTLDYLGHSKRLDRMRFADEVEYYWPVKNADVAFVGN